MKQTADYYLHLNQSLRNFAGVLGRTLGDIEFEYLEGEGYVNGEYFRAFDDQLELTLAYCNDSQANDYRFWLHVVWNSTESRQDFLMGLERTLFIELAAHDPQIAQVANLGQRTQKIFHLDREEVLQEESHPIKKNAASAEKNRMKFADDDLDESDDGEDFEHSHGDEQIADQGREFQERFALLQIVDIQKSVLSLIGGNLKIFFFHTANKHGQ